MRRLAAAALAATILILGQAGIRGYLAAKEKPRYPCAFQEKDPKGRWIGKLSLREANAARARSVRIGQRIAIRLNDVSQADAPGMIDCVAKAYGMDSAPFQSVAQCESHGDPEAINPAGPFHGIFQYLPATWAGSSKAYGHAGASIHDGYAQINVTVQKVKAEGWGAWGICI
jgi:hypothetical protein